MSNFFNNLFENIKKNKKIQIFLIVLVVIFITFIIFFNNKNNDIEANDTDYVSKIEEQLEEIIGNIDGVGKVDVMITVDGTSETILASTITEKETINGKETESTPILVNGKTITLKENNPNIQGVLIVCEGAKKIAVVNAIINATTSLLNIDYDKIQVVKMK